MRQGWQSFTNRLVNLLPYRYYKEIFANRIYLLAKKRHYFLVKLTYRVLIIKSYSKSKHFYFDFNCNQLKKVTVFTIIKHESDFTSLNKR